MGEELAPEPEPAPLATDAAQPDEAGAQASPKSEADAAPAEPAQPAPALVPAGIPQPSEPARPALQAVRVTHAPKIDGVLDDAEWQRAPAADVFTQKAPLVGRAPSEKTTMRLVYDDDALYVAFDCDQVQSPIVARLARRDRPSETDWVSIAFDSRAEGRSAFEFSVSAAGVLIDGLRFDDGKISREWDEIWEAKSALRAHGWSAEFRVPLQALRFEPAANQSWGMQARRYISARQELDEWAYISPDVGGEVSHYGRVEQLRDLDNASLELLPFVLGRATYQASDPGLVHGGWLLQPSAGLDFKWRPATNFVLNGTINPDFGQVEADQIILNLSTVELAFPEKRPFFLAGMDDFATLTPIFYSRRIGRTPKPPPLARTAVGKEWLYDYPQPSPIYGALKLAGDLHGGWNVAALSALTGPNEVDIVSPDGTRRARLIDPTASYNVLRVRTEPAPRFDIGVIGAATVRAEPNTTAGSSWPPSWLTSSTAYPSVETATGAQPEQQRCPQGELTGIGERCSHDAYVGSADFVWTSPSGEYAIRGQGYGSAIEDGPTRKLPDGTLIGAGDLGGGGTLRLSKQGGEHLLLDGTVAASSRKLDFNDLGFLPRQNDARAGVYAEYRTLDPWFVLNETHTAALAYGANNLDGLALSRGVLVMESLVFTSRWMLTLGGYANAAHFDDREVGDGTALERAAMLGAVQSVTSDTRSALVMSAEIAEELLENGQNWNAQIGMTWHPWSAAELQLVPSYTFNDGEPRYAGPGVSPTDLVFGRLEAESLSVTMRASYTFLPALTLQAYAQVFFATELSYDYMHFSAPASGPRPIVQLSDLVPGGPPSIVPDFERASLAVNVVLRWEYHLGSTLYLLYARSQNPNVTLDPFETPRIDPYVLRNAPATDVLMVKLAYWLG